MKTFNQILVSTLFMSFVSIPSFADWRPQRDAIEVFPRTGSPCYFWGNFRASCGKNKIRAKCNGASLQDQAGADAAAYARLNETLNQNHCPHDCNEDASMKTEVSGVTTVNNPPPVYRSTAYKEVTLSCPLNKTKGTLVPSISGVFVDDEEYKLEEGSEESLEIQ